MDGWRTTIRQDRKKIGKNGILRKAQHCFSDDSTESAKGFLPLPRSFECGRQCFYVLLSTVGRFVPSESFVECCKT